MSISTLAQKQVSVLYFLLDLTSPLLCYDESIWHVKILDLKHNNDNIRCFCPMFIKLALSSEVQILGSTMLPIILRNRTSGLQISELFYIPTTDCFDNPQIFDSKIMELIHRSKY